jgi:hypothetical protein
MLVKVVQRWRIGASRFEWQNTKWKVVMSINTLLPPK